MKKRMYWLQRVMAVAAVMVTTAVPINTLTVLAQENGTQAETTEEHMKLIAECGYTAVQTSPAQQPKDYTYQGNVCNEVGYPGLSGKGNWWKL